MSTTTLPQDASNYVNHVYKRLLNGASWKLDNSTVPNGPNPRPSLVQSPPDDDKEEMRLLTGVEIERDQRKLGLIFQVVHYFHGVFSQRPKSRAEARSLTVVMPPYNQAPF